jgi:hypothetical protein
MVIKKRTSPLSAERWVKKQTCIAIFTVVFFGFLCSSLIRGSHFLSIFYDMGLVAICTSVVLEIIYIRCYVEEAYDAYVARFHKDKEKKIDPRVIRMSYIYVACFSLQVLCLLCWG